MGLVVGVEVENGSGENWDDRGDEEFVWTVYLLGGVLLS